MALAGSLERGGKCVKRGLRAGCRICTSIETGAREKTKNFTQRTQRAQSTQRKKGRRVGRGEDEGHGPRKRTQGKIPALAWMDARHGARRIAPACSAAVARGCNGLDGIDASRGRGR